MNERERERENTFVEEKSVYWGERDGKGGEEGGKLVFSVQSKLTEKQRGRNSKGFLKKLLRILRWSMRDGKLLFSFERFQNDGNKRSVVRTWNETLIKNLFILFPFSPLFLSSSFPLPPLFLFSSFKGGAIIAFRTVSSKGFAEFTRDGMIIKRNFIGDHICRGISA